MCVHVAEALWDLWGIWMQIKSFLLYELSTYVNDIIAARAVMDFFVNFRTICIFPIHRVQFVRIRTWLYV